LACELFLPRGFIEVFPQALPIGFQTDQHIIKDRMKKEYAIRSMSSLSSDNEAFTDGLVEIGEYHIGGKTEVSTTEATECI
jgi:hypothetical protein